MSPLARFGAGVRARWRVLVITGGLWMTAALSAAGAYGAVVLAAAILAYDAWGAAAAAATACVCLLLGGAGAALSAWALKRWSSRRRERNPAELASVAPTHADSERSPLGSLATDPLVLTAALIVGAAIVLGPRRLVRWGMQAWAFTRLVRNVLEPTGGAAPDPHHRAAARNGRAAAHE